MVGSGRIVGLGMMIGSGVLLLAVGAWAATAFGSEETSASGMVLGLVLALLVLTPVFGVGVYLFRAGTQETAQHATVQQERKLLNIVLTQGQVSMPELAVELGVGREQVEEMVRALVGKQLFSGAVNWQKGVLYSVESQALTGNSKCPNCGGDLKFAGKGLIVCPYCGSEVFLTKRAAAETGAAGTTA